MYHSSLNVFMTNKTHSAVKKHCESAKPGSHQTAKIFFFLSLPPPRQLWNNFFTCMHGQRALSNEAQQLLKIAELEVQSVQWRQYKSIYRYCI